MPEQTAAHPINLVEMWIYPVKSCRGISVQQAEIHPEQGLQGDREWVVLNSENALEWQGAIPQMARIQPEVTANHLVLHHEGFQDLRVEKNAPRESCEVQIWNDTLKVFETFGGEDAGPEAQHWLTEVLGQPLRLVRLNAQALVRQALQPIHLLSLSSLQHLNERLEVLGKKRIELERFRPNLVVEGTGPVLPAYAEERLSRVVWPQSTRPLELHLTEPCVRCIMPNIDLNTARIEDEPLRTVTTLSKERAFQAPMFGMYGRALQSGTLRVGDLGALL